MRRCIPVFLLSLSAFGYPLTPAHAAGAADTAATAAMPLLVIPPGEAVAGRTQQDWSQAWWEWAGSFDIEDSPVADLTGERCASRQAGPVWFLAGTYGTHRVNRSCAVPAGKYLFFPLINFLVASSPDLPIDCLSATSAAASWADDTSALVFDLDGVRFGGMQTHRLATRGCFDAGAQRMPPRALFPSAGDGYYLMLRPLARGRHTLNFGGVMPSMIQAVTYTLDVE